jgi:hypothetical protein
VTVFQSGQLDSEQCLSLLARVHIGRVGLVLGPVPFIYPVHYDMSQGHIFFDVAFDQVAAVMNDAVVALQADGFEEDHGCHWSVLAVGPATSVDTFVPGSTEHGRSEGRAFRLRPKMFSGHWLDQTGHPL